MPVKEITSSLFYTLIRNGPTITQSIRNPGMLDPTIPDRGHMSELSTNLEKLFAKMAPVWNCRVQHSGVFVGLPYPGNTPPS